MKTKSAVLTVLVLAAASVAQIQPAAGGSEGTGTRGGDVKSPLVWQPNLGRLCNSGTAKDYFESHVPEFSTELGILSRKNPELAARAEEAVQRLPRICFVPDTGVDEQAPPVLRMTFDRVDVMPGYLSMDAIQRAKQWLNLLTSPAVIND